MYGLLKRCGLKGPSRRSWSAHYCGICAALGMHVGQWSRLLLHSDAVAISALCEAQEQRPTRMTSIRCPFRRFRTSHVIQPSAESARYAAGVSVLIGASKILDHVVDRDNWTRLLPNVFRARAQSWISSARHLCRSIDIDISPVQDQLSRQLELEQIPRQDFLFYSQAVEAGTGLVCAGTAKIANIPDNEEPLFHVGRLYGRIIYLTDSFRDYWDDLAQGKFNPLAQAPSAGILREKVRTLFDSAYDELVRHYGRLHLFRPHLSNDIFLNRLPEAVEAQVFMNGPASAHAQHEKDQGESSSCLSYCDCCNCGCPDCTPGDCGCPCNCDCGCPCDCG